MMLRKFCIGEATIIILSELIYICLTSNLYNTTFKYFFFQVYIRNGVDSFFHVFSVHWSGKKFFNKVYYLKQETQSFQPHISIIIAGNKL